MPASPAIVIEQAILGGIADSPYMGPANSLAQIVGFNLHKVPGLFLVNQRLALNSPASGANIIDDLVKIVPCTDGNIYLLGKTNGKVWKIDNAGTYTYLTTILNQKWVRDYPGTGADDTTVGTVVWSNPGNATADDTSVATAVLDGGLTSHDIKVTNFGFAIPSTATIKGIVVEVERYSTVVTGASVKDNEVKLVKPDTTRSTNKANATNWATAAGAAYVSYGTGYSDLWGLTLTPTDVNSSSFGVVVSATGTGATASANVNAVRVTVYYQETGVAQILDAREYYGYIYYAMAGQFLGAWKVGDPWTTRNDMQYQFFNGNLTNHPMIVQNLVLYIGDGNWVAQVDASAEAEVPSVPRAFSPQALQVVPEEIVTALGLQSTNLLVGTKNINGRNHCGVYNWNTWSQSFQQIDPVPENGVNAFMPDKLSVIISAGENGAFYEYARSFYGQYLQPLRQIPSNFPQLYTPTNKATLFHTAVDTHQNIPIFGLSRVVGNPALQGIYTLGQRDPRYPSILTLEYPISTANLSNLTIWSIATVSNDLYVSWKDETDPLNTKYGIDKLDWNNKINGAYIVSRITKYTRVLMDLFKDFVVNYDQCPTGTSIDFYYRINNQLNGDGTPKYTKFDTTEFVNDTDRAMFKATNQINAKTIQFMIVVNSSGNTAPNIEDATVIMG